MAPLFLPAFRAAVQGPAGCDVLYAPLTTARGILTRAEHQQDDGSGLATPIYGTTLLVEAGAIPGVAVDALLTVYPELAAWITPDPARTGLDYRVSRVGRVDDLGTQELVLREAH